MLTCAVFPRSTLLKVPRISPCAFATARQCAITLLPNNVEMSFWCLHIGFSHPGNQFRAVITSIIKISQRYGGGGTNITPGKWHFVVQCNNLFNKPFIHIQKSKETNVISTNNILRLFITVRHQITSRLPYIRSRHIRLWPMWYPPASCFYSKGGNNNLNLNVRWPRVHPSGQALY